MEGAIAPKLVAPAVSQLSLLSHSPQSLLHHLLVHPYLKFVFPWSFIVVFTVYFSIKCEVNFREKHHDDGANNVLGNIHLHQ